MDHKALRKFSIVFLTVLGILIAAGLIYRVRQNENSNAQNDTSYMAVVGDQLKPTDEQPTEEDAETPVEIKSQVLLPVPFTAQAPTANWDELHNEACEEASVIMAAQYFSGNNEAKLPASLVESEISKITDWLKNEYGYYLDTTVDETANFAENIYSLKTEQIKDFTEDDIKKALSEGKLVLLSENGRLLGNPNYKAPGPIHHMLVIKGYDTKGFITNDSGTRNGKDYRYSFKTLQAAAADWVHDRETTDTSIKTALVVWK